MTIMPDLQRSVDHTAACIQPAVQEYRPFAPERKLYGKKKPGKNRTTKTASKFRAETGKTESSASKHDLLGRKIRLLQRASMKEKANNKAFLKGNGFLSGCNTQLKSQVTASRSKTDWSRVCPVRRKVLAKLI